MSTINSTLRMMDAMTRPLRNITQGMQMLISTMEQMQRTAERDEKVSKMLSATKSKISSAEADIAQSIEATTKAQEAAMRAAEQEARASRAIAKEKGKAATAESDIAKSTNATSKAKEAVQRATEGAAKAQEQHNRSIQTADKSSSRLLETVKGLAATYLTIESLKRLGSATIGGAMEQQKMEDMFVARTGNEPVGRAMFQQFKAEALAAGQDVTKALQSTMSFYSMTQNTNQLSKLNNLAQRLNAFDSAGNGIEGAAFALKEAMSGDIVSLAERFNMSKADIRAFKITDFANKGDINGFITAFDKLMEKQKMGQAAFDKMLASPAKQLELLQNNMRSGFADAGTAAMKALLPLIIMLNQAAQAGKFQVFFDLLSRGLAALVNEGMWLLKVIGEIYHFFSNNWPTIEPILWGIVGAMAAWTLATRGQALAQKVMAFATGTGTFAIFAQTLATQGLAAAWATLNTAMKANVIILIISLVIGLVTWLVHLWKTNDDFAAGFMRAWNMVLNFFDQVPIFFQSVSNGIVNAFESAKVKSLKLMEDLINGVIDRMNGLIDKLNGVKGVSISSIEKVEFVATAAAQADYLKKAGEDALSAMKESAAARAAARKQNVLDMLSTRATKRATEQTTPAAPGKYDFTAWNQQADIDRIKSIGEVGKIKDKVDISSEDLRMMRELAEMKSIQNFVSLTPTVQVTTGPVGGESDIDTIVARIEDKLVTQIASSAKGVYELV
ncbi:hypothetical protein FE784_00790 [Paenibacillus hemerocallicola]|uniref:Uncharacterized protein n=1 Tax=Paenibacillus hemerocallicola TaxID=1172614 RepID=A0A5C4TID5_9BACL|nr:hypothetical protein [Paenibacillus hemerocallicola]TNJ68230.1 hypothetical protein FE784_00790 [Paenibacillus hemerocallicola]